VVEFPQNKRVGAHAMRPTSAFQHPKNFMDSMDSIGGAQAMRPYPMELIDLTPKISGYHLEELEHRVLGDLCY
jgi:hypothetical protein